MKTLWIWTKEAVRLFFEPVRRPWGKLALVALWAVIALATFLTSCDRPLFEPLPQAKQPICTKSTQVIHGDTTLALDSQRVSITICVSK